MKIINLDVKKVAKQLDLFPPVAAWEIEILKDINEFEKTLLAIKKEKLKFISLKRLIEKELGTLSSPDDLILIDEMRKKIAMQEDLKAITEWLFGIDDFIHQCEIEIEETKLNLAN